MFDFCRFTHCAFATFTAGGKFLTVELFAAVLCISPYVRMLGMLVSYFCVTLCLAAAVWGGRVYLGCQSINLHWGEELRAADTVVVKRVLRLY